jgi:hypothetical protein
VQATETGAAPPVTVGEAYCTVAPALSVDGTCRLAGHVTDGGPGGGGVG